LYGTTYYGGTSTCSYPGCGTIFKINTSGSTFTTLHSFAGSDGTLPWAGLIQATDGNLYGTTLFGGASNHGTIFKIDTSGTLFATLHSFTSTDGAGPYGGLIQGTDGNLYGTTAGGGASGYGTIFKIDTSGTTFTTLHSFAGSDGANPYAGLLQATDGNLYGTASAGGSGEGGVVFRISACYFNDVPSTDPYYPFICTIAQAGITSGCGGGNYCPNDPVTRAQMAVFLLRAKYGPSYTPPACTPPGPFGDVPCPGAFAVDWIEQLYAEGVTGGCGGGNYCPDDPNTRGQMAVFLVVTFGL
ncbi:MAG: choice-of-anchor tandem repeat GloVer-containing protein, partial [Thermoanaerobaculia bacterium]